MLTLLSLVLCATPPAAGLTLSTQLGRPAVPLATVLDAVEQALVAGKLPVRRLGLPCDGDRDCLAKGARDAGLPAIVSLSIAWSKKQATLDVEALRSADGVSLAQLTFTFPGRLSEANREALRELAGRVVEGLAPARSDAPRVEATPALTVPAPPAEPQPELLVTTPAPAKRSQLPAWVMGGGAVASGVAAGIFLGLASSASASLQADPSPLTRAQAETRAEEANRDYSVALATGLAAGALATGAIVWLLAE